MVLLPPGDGRALGYTIALLPTMGISRRDVVQGVVSVLAWWSHVLDQRVIQPVYRFSTKEFVKLKASTPKSSIVE